MAVLQSTDSLEEYIGNKYSLVIVAAKRARQIREGHVPLVQDTSPNPISKALTEVTFQKLRPIAPPEDDVIPASRDDIASLVHSSDFDLEGDLDLADSDAVDDLAALLASSDAEDAEEEDPTADDSEDAEEEEEDEEEDDDEEVEVDPILGAADDDDAEGD